jgi:hypothetical protein
MPLSAPAPRVQSARGRTAASRHVHEQGAGRPVGSVVSLAEERGPSALVLNDVVVRRLFAAGLDLQAALALTDDHRAAGKIGHAIDGLDQAIREIRDTIFNRQ